MPQTHKATFTIHVNPSPSGISFNPDGGPLQPATVGVDVANEPVTVIDGGTRPYSVSVTGGTLPDGLSLAQGTSSVVLQGVPTVAGDFTFEITATDSGV
jgi:hypothetical protein